jgi:hypothetical protein
MIESSNVRAYINYLHQMRTGNSAEIGLLNKWSSLSEDEIQIQLANLYEHWNLSDTQAKIHEQNFIRFSQPTEISNSTQLNDLAKQKNIAEQIVEKKSNTILIVTISIIVGLGMGAMIYWIMNTKKPLDEISDLKPQIMAPPVSTIQDTITQSIVQPTIDSTILNSDSISSLASNTSSFELNVSDQKNIQSIKELLDAEIHQDFAAVVSFYADNMLQYWDLTQPSHEMLEERYKAVWSKIEHPENRNIQFGKVGERQYKLTGVFDYWSKVKDEQRSIPIHTIFSFNEEGKINYVNDEK